MLADVCPDPSQRFCVNSLRQATKRVAELASKMQHLKVFCHVSTAYVNSWKGQYEHVEERIYQLHLSDGRLVDHVEIAAQLHKVDPETAEKKVCFHTLSIWSAEGDFLFWGWKASHLPRGDTVVGGRGF